jgi:hypothetical protein
MMLNIAYSCTLLMENVCIQAFLLEDGTWAMECLTYDLNTSRLLDRQRGPKDHE